MNIYNFDVIDIDGKKVSLSKYKGKVLLIVNVASLCGFTPQYEALQKLYDSYKKDGFEILAFPSNQFKNQEPKDNTEIKKFCQLRYNITFDMFSKVDVNGINEIPLYKFLKDKQKGFLNNEIKWNFTKFLVDREGNVVGRYAPVTKPEKIKRDIEKLLS